MSDKVVESSTSMTSVSTLNSSALVTKSLDATTSSMMLNSTIQKLPDTTTMPTTKERMKKGSKKRKNYIDSRYVIDAPEKCKEGYGFARYRCRKIYDGPLIFV